MMRSTSTISIKACDTKVYSLSPDPRLFSINKNTSHPHSLRICAFGILFADN